MPCAPFAASVSEPASEPYQKHTMSDTSDAKDGAEVKAPDTSYWTQSVVDADDLRTLDLYEGDEKDRVHQAKIRILNHAIQEIGMGKYQVRTKRSHSFLTDSLNLSMVFIENH